MNNEVWVLYQMSIGRTAIDKIVGIYATKDSACKFADDTMGVWMSQAYEDCENVTVVSRWLQRNEMHHQASRVAWDFEGKHHTVEIDDKYRVERFEVEA